MHHSTKLPCLLQPIAVANAFSDWLHDEGDTVVASANLLGGPKWAARAATVIEGVRNGDKPAFYIREFRAFCRLFHLEFSDELWSLEAQRFSAIHPDDPRAEEARVCAEALSRGVWALEHIGLAGVSGKEEAA